MVFSSPLFLSFFLPVLFGLYFLAQTKLRNYVLLAASLFFYSWGEPKAVVIMCLLIGVNYLIGYYIGVQQEKSSSAFPKSLCPRTKAILALSVGIFINLGVLIFYKYLSFLINNVNSILMQMDKDLLNDPGIPLPIGISFYIFQIISYLVDVYRKEVKPQKNLFSLALYISLFPQLVAGPIVRYTTICEDLENRKTNFDNVFKGIHRFVIGLAKKVLIADSMALIADKIFDSPVSQLPCGFAWIGAIAYALQIYFDFSGYSDMAIGLGRIFNFRFLENFNFPYSAVSIQDFWRRWHISLSSWLRDYLYIPLGGNRKGRLRTYINLFTVFLLCGLWHGASWNFVAWGAYHGTGLIAERAGLKKVLALVPPLIGNLYVLLFVLIGWVIFRANTLEQAKDYLKVMFMGNSAYSMNSFYTALQFITFSNVEMMLVGIILSYPLFSKWFNKIQYKPLGIVWMMILFAVAYTFAMTSHFSPFIYFRF